MRRREEVRHGRELALQGAEGRWWWGVPASELQRKAGDIWCLVYPEYRISPGGVELLRGVAY